MHWSRMVRAITLLFVLGIWSAAATPTSHAQAPAGSAEPRAQAASEASSATRNEDLGAVHVVLFGPSAQALTDVAIEVEGRATVTNAEGAATIMGLEGARTVRLRVPSHLLPGTPTEGPAWIVDLADIPFVPGETTELIVTLGESGALVGLDIQAPDAAGGDRSLAREFQKALAEKPKGQVVGRVVAAEGGAKVAGAQVYVRGAPIEASSDEAGAFSLVLPVGSYRLSVIHPRFSTQGVPDVIVRENERTELTVELSPASAELDELVVTAPHIEGGVATLIAERRETSAVADVIGAEQMSRSGDSSAASALARVTGLTVIDGKFVVVRGMGERYSSMTLNRLQVPSPEPTRRVVPLDLFPTGVLESVVVQKTYSPDMPGEFGGGIVQLRTRGYPDELLVSLTAQTGANTQTHLRQNDTYEGGATDFLGIDDGTRALPGGLADADKVFKRNRFTPEGKGYTEEEILDFARSLKGNYGLKRELTPPDLSLVASVGNKLDLRDAKLGFVASVGYKNQYRTINDQTVRTVSIANDELLIQDDFVLDAFDRQVSLSGFLDTGVEFSKEHQVKSTTMLLRQTEDSTRVRRGFNDDVATETERTRLSWVEQELLDQQVVGKHVFSSLSNFQIDWRYSFARASRDEPDRRDYQYDQDKNDGVYRLSVAPGDNQRLFGFGRDTSHQADVDLTQPFPVWSDLTAKVKVGGMYYTRDRESDVRRFEFDVSQQPGSERELPPNQVFNGQFLGTTQGFLETTFDNDSYSAGFDLQAGYGMLELPIIEPLEIMTGARVEHAVIEVTTVDQFAPDKPPEIGKLDDVDVLPATTATYRIMKDLQMRAGYSRTLNRPDLRELSSSRYNDIETGALLKGNPELKRATIDSFDARVEWYLSADETFSLGGFYKNFHDPIEATISASVGLLLSFANSDEARVWGVELDGRKRLDFLDEHLDSVFVAGNFSWIDSQVKFALPGGGSAERPLQSQSPWVINAQLGYDDTLEGGTGTAVALLYNVAGERIRFVGDPEDNIPDQYELSFHRLDLVASQRLPHGLSLGAKAQNLLNPVQKWTQGDIVVRRFKRGADFYLSLAWSY